MRTYNVGLNTKDLTKLSSYLKTLALSVKTQDNKILSTLVMQGAEIARSNLSGIVDPDGNLPGQITTEIIASVGTISNVGPQVAFLEFGTGITGASSPHPLAPNANWQYDLKTSRVANRTIEGVEGWFYYDNIQGAYRFSSGISPNSHMLNTALALRRIVNVTAKIHLEGWLN